MPSAKRIRTSVLDLAYEESGASDGAPVFLMHGWPYDPRCYDEVVPPLRREPLGQPEVEQVPELDRLGGALVGHLPSPLHRHEPRGTSNSR